MQQYQKFTKYSELKGLKPGIAQFDQAWKAVAKRDPNGFAAEQHEFVKTNYYDRANKRLKKNGLDFSDRGAGVQDMIWSTSVQYGNKKVIERALSGRNIRAMTDEQIINTVQDYKLAHYREHFASTYRRGLKGKSIMESIISRIKNERRDLINLSRRGK